jgi:hypothetical protein
LRGLQAAIVMCACVVLAGCTVPPVTQGNLPPGVPRVAPLPVSAEGTGAIEADLLGVGWEGTPSNRQMQVQWVIAVGQEEQLQIADLTYDDSTRVFVNGTALSGLGPHGPSLTLEDVGSWPVRVEYARAGSQGGVRATRVDVAVSETWLREVTKEP